MSIGAHSLSCLRPIVPTLLLHLVLVLLIAILGIFRLVYSRASILQFLWLNLWLSVRLLVGASINHLISLLLHAIGLLARGFLILLILLILPAICILLLALLVRVGVTAKFLVSLDELL